MTDVLSLRRKLRKKLLKGDLKGALKIASLLEEEHPSPYIKLVLGTIMYITGDMEKSRSLFEEAYSQLPREGISEEACRRVMGKLFKSF